MIIDAGFKDGFLTYGDFLINGSSYQNFIVSTYLCHPSLANDNLSGLILTVLLKKLLENHKKYHNTKESSFDLLI